MIDEITISPRVRKSPFFDAARADGACRYTIYNHMYMPTSFGDPAAEYDRLINSCAMWDVACERQVQMLGPDAGRLADYLSARDLSQMKVGISKYAPLCNHAGHLINDPVALRVAEDCYWFSLADSDIGLFAAAVAGERGWDVTVSEPDVSPLAIQGPNAMAVAAELLGDWVQALKFFHFKSHNLDGIALVVARSGWSKQGGVELYLRDETQGTRLWRLVCEAGAAHGIGPGSPNTIERVESDLLSYGGDNDSKTDPFEVGLGKFVDLDQPGDFVGKQALKKFAVQGPKRQRIGVFLDGAPVQTNSEKLKIEAGGREVGMINAMVHSPRLNRNIAIALVNSNMIDDPTVDLVAVTDEGRRSLQATTLPFI